MAIRQNLTHSTIEEQVMAHTVQTMKSSSPLHSNWFEGKSCRQ